MKPLSTTLLLLLPQIGLGNDYLWFEDYWISDADATLEANPQVQQLEEEFRTKFRSLFGRTTWYVANGVLLSSHPQGWHYSAPYFLRPISEATFEVILDGAAGTELFTIDRTEGGFCAKAHPSWNASEEAWSQPPFVECFARYRDALSGEDE